MKGSGTAAMGPLSVASLSLASKKSGDRGSACVPLKSRALFPNSSWIGITTAIGCRPLEINLSSSPHCRHHPQDGTDSGDNDEKLGEKAS